MTVINVGSSPSASIINTPDSHERKTQGTSTSTFSIQIPEEHEVPLNQLEQRILNHALQFGLPDTPEIRKHLVKAVKKTNRSNMDEHTLANDVISILFDELENKNNRSSTPHPLPVHGCSERPESSPNLSCPSAAVSPIHTNFEKENSDYQKAIQASLMDSSTSLMRPFNTAAPENPKDLLREDEMPVGMHNIGQTCWFSVIAQILYHIPQFRKVVYEANVKNSLPSNENCETNVLKALRELFACMDSSLQRYLDPEPTLRVLSACNKVYERNSGELIGHQQDVVEMLLRLVDWLEKALQKTSAVNPIALDTSINEAQTIDFNKMEVSPCIATNSSASLAEHDISSTSMDTSITADADGDTVMTNVDQFKTPHLPTSTSAYWSDSPLRSIFHTSLMESKNGGERLLQNQSMLMLILDLDYEDLHSAFEHQNLLGDKQVHYSTLPSVMFVNLKRFQYDPHTGVSQKVNKHFHFPPTLFLDRYMENNSDVVNRLLQERNGLEVQLSHFRAELNGYQQFPVGNTCAPLADILAASSSFIGGMVVSSTNDRVLPSIAPSDNNAHLKTMLERLSAEIRQKEEELKRVEERLKFLIGSTFLRDDLLKQEYHLRAVVIHEGDLNSGHYWAYILKHHTTGDVWLKMNDRSVEISSWDEIAHEAYGNKSSTSAYCMAYVRADAGNTDDTLQLPDDLMQYVTQHNIQLQNRIFEYSEKQTVQKPKPIPKLLTPIHNPEHLERDLCQQNLPEPHDFEWIKTRCERFEDIVSHTYPAGINNEAARNTSLESQMQSLKQRIDRLCLDSELFSGKYDPRTVFDNVDPTKINQIYQGIVSRWYEYPPGEKVTPADRLRLSYDDCDPLHFWRLTDIGMPAWIHRYILLKAMQHSQNFKEFARFAEEELTAFELVHMDSMIRVSYQYRHMLVMYQIVKDIWFLLAHIMEGMQRPSALFSGDNINEFTSIWRELFYSAFYITTMYDELASEISLLKGAPLDLASANRCIAPNIVVRAVFSVTVLQLYAVLTECLISEKSIEELYSLLDGKIQLLMLVATNKLSKYAKKGCKPSAKISSCLTHMLSISQTFPTVQGCERKSVILQDFIDATDPNRDIEFQFENYPICHSYDMPQIVNKVNFRRTEVGFSDESDIDTTLERICTEIVSKTVFAHSS